MDLDSLPVRHGFRLRGEQISRLETFVDSAFAFAVTLLVISVGSLPKSVPELMDALRNVPTFGLCFAQIMLFWISHNRWSRRYGLDDGTSTALSLLLVFVTLIFVYPLRVVVSSGLGYMTRGWLPSQIELNSMAELQDCFLIFGLGFTSLSLIVFALHRHALRRAVQLQLDDLELLETRRHATQSLVEASVGAISIAMTFALRHVQVSWMAGLPGFTYMALSVALPLLHWRFDRKVALLGPRR